MTVGGVAVSHETGSRPIDQPAVMLRQLRAHVGHAGQHSPILESRLSPGDWSETMRDTNDASG